MSARFVYAGAAWEVDADRRELRTHGRPIPIGSRAFEIMEKLAQSGGTFVTKDELVAHVWRGLNVDENTLRVHIHAIRKALGPDRSLLKTAAGRGYQLLGPWTTVPTGEPPDAADTTVSVQNFRQLARSNLPASTPVIVGRGAPAQLLRDLVTAFRVVTLTGPGGIGKTTLAVKVARDVIDEFNGAVFLVELGSMSDPDLVPSTVARALGLIGEGKQLTNDEVAQTIGDARLLVVLDNCEHLIDAIARLAEAIVWHCPHASILATSREVMKIDGERVFRLPPLQVPAGDEAADRLLECSAVELFVQRTQSLDDGFALGTHNSDAVATICRHLDGIPLAIEFAAGRAATLGVQQVVNDLRDRLSLLTSRRRTAIPRHKTLRAVLDWSYDLLPVAEQKFLRSLAVFAGHFRLDDAAAICGAPAETAGWLSGLVDRSLVVAEARGSTTLYRLLDTTRTYALEKLEGHDELETLSRSHADYYRRLFEAAEPQWQTRTTTELHFDYAWRLDNLRSALAWALTNERDASMAVSLATAAIPLWMHLSLFEECRRLLAEASSLEPAVKAMEPGRQMRLHAAYGVASLYSGGDPVTAEAACAKALEIAEGIGDVDHQLRALWGLWLVRRGSLDLAKRFLAMAVKPVDEVVGHRMVATSYHVQGHQTEARPHVDFIRAHPNVLTADPARFRFLVMERPMSEEPGLARILWAQGCPDQAMQLVRQSLKAAVAAGHANSLCHFMALAGCLVTLWCGDLEEADRYIAILSDHAARFTLLLWRSWSTGYRGMLALQAGDPAVAAELLRVAVEELRALHEWRGYVHFSIEHATALGKLGRADEGLALIAEPIRRNDIMEGWMHPELHRVRGDLLALNKTPASDEEAERSFRAAMEEASRQGALAWQLRAATGLARLLRHRDRAAAAREVLAPVYDRFTEGFDTADLRAARALLKNPV